MFKKRMALAASMLASATLLAGVAPTSAQQSKLSGNLNVFLQAYYDPTGDQDTATLAQSIAKEYEQLHPGVTITLVPNVPSGQDTEAYLAARMAAGQAPDVMWEQYSNRNLRGSSWWVPLNKYLDAPNPYIAKGTKGSDKWSDSLPDYVLSEIRAADGNYYEVSLDWVETGLYYNKDLFDKNGINPSNWKNWGQFVNDLQTLKTKTGTDPIGIFVRQQGWSNWYWADDTFLSAAWGDGVKNMYLAKYNDPNRPVRQLNPEEMAKAIIGGKLSAADPHMDAYLKLSKQFSTLFPADYAGVSSLDDLSKPFYAGTLASVWSGTWANKPFTTSAPFTLGVTYLPPITKDDAPNAQNTAYRVGGPSGAAQYGIAQSAVQNGKLDLAVDFLQFLSAPQNIGRLIKTNGGFVPMVAGAETSPVMQGFTGIAALPERLFNDPDSRLGVEQGDQWAQAMQAYFLGKTDDAATKTALQKIWMDGAVQLCAKQKYDWCPATNGTAAPTAAATASS